MEEYAVQKLLPIVDDMEKQLNKIQVQALNNLDELFAVQKDSTGKEMPVVVDQAMRAWIDRMVKKPLMLAVSRLNGDKLMIWKLCNGDKRPQGKEKSNGDV